jgi:serralysin
VIGRRAVLGAGLAASAGTLLTTGPAVVSPPPDPYPDGTYAMMCLGDSITAGLTADSANGGDGYRAYLLDDLSVRNERPVSMVGSLRSGGRQLYHEGHSGWTINQIGGAVNFGSLAPQFVVLLAGANDFGDAYKRTWDQARDDTGALLDRLLTWAPWTRVVLCEQILMSGGVSHDLTKSTWQQQAFNAALPELVAGKAGRVVLARTSVIGQGMLDGSGVHPTDVGYRWMAYAIYYALAPWLGHLTGTGRWMTNIPVPAGSPRPLAIL